MDTVSALDLVPLHVLVLSCVVISQRDEAALGMSTEEQMSPKTLNTAVTHLTRVSTMAREAMSSTAVNSNLSTLNVNQNPFINK